MFYLFVYLYACVCDDKSRFSYICTCILVFICIYARWFVRACVRVYYSENQLQTMDMLAGLVCPYCYCPNEDRLSDDSTKVSQCYAEQLLARGCFWDSEYEMEQSVFCYYNNSNSYTGTPNHDLLCLNNKT